MRPSMFKKEKVKKNKRLRSRTSLSFFLIIFLWFNARIILFYSIFYKGGKKN